MIMSEIELTATVNSATISGTVSCSSLVGSVATSTVCAAVNATISGIGVYVPYVGCLKNVDLGNFNLTTTDIITAGSFVGVLANGVTATTQSVDDNSTKVATTAYVDTAVEVENIWDKIGTSIVTHTTGDDVDLGGSFNVNNTNFAVDNAGYEGKVGIGTVTPSVELDVVGSIKSTDYEGSLVDGVTATTQSADDNSTKVATTEYVDAQVDTEDFWDRTGTILSPNTAGDAITTTGDITGRTLTGTGLDINATAVSGREVLLKAKISDGGNDQFGVANGTNRNGEFAPTFYGYKDSDDTPYSMNFRAMVDSTNDQAGQGYLNYGMLNFEFYRTTSPTDPNNGTLTRILNRKLFAIINGAGASRTYPFQVNADDSIEMTGNVTIDNGLEVKGLTNDYREYAFTSRNSHDAALLRLRCDGQVDISDLGLGDVKLFQNSPDSTTSKLSIYGFLNHDALRSLDISMSPYKNDRALFDGVSTYEFDGTILGNANLGITTYGSIGTGLTVNATRVSTGDLKWNSDTVSAAVLFDATGAGEAEFNCPVSIDGITKIGDGGTTNYVNINSTGNMTFNGSAGFYPRTLSQDAEPAAGTGATQIDSGEQIIWVDTNDSNRTYMVYNYGGTIVKVELT